MGVESGPHSMPIQEGRLMIRAQSFRRSPDRQRSLVVAVTVVWLVVLASTGCAVKFIGDYDEAIDTGVSDVQQRAEVYFGKLKADPSTPLRSWLLQRHQCPHEWCSKHERTSWHKIRSSNSSSRNCRGSSIVCRRSTRGCLDRSPSAQLTLPSRRSPSVWKAFCGWNRLETR